MQNWLALNEEIRSSLVDERANTNEEEDENESRTETEKSSEQEEPSEIKTI